MNNTNTTGYIVAKLRVGKGLTMSGLAKMSGLDAMTIHNVECGCHEPNITTLRKLATAFGIEVKDIVGKDSRYYEILKGDDNE